MHMRFVLQSAWQVQNSDANTFMSQIFSRHKYYLGRESKLLHLHTILPLIGMV